MTTTVSPIRQGFRTVTPYLVVHGAARLLDFLKSAYAAEEIFRVSRPDGSIMHADARIGDSMLELADATTQYPATRSALHLYVEDADAVYQRAVEAGGISLGAPVDQPYGDREAGVADSFGNNWFVATHQGSHFIPQGLYTITPCFYPHAAGRMIKFLERAFGAETKESYESPQGTIVHAKIRIGDSMVEIGEAHGQWQPLLSMTHLYVPDADAVYRSAVDAGATSLFEPRDEPYGDRVGAVTDAFGHQWFIATHIQDVHVSS